MSFLSYSDPLAVSYPVSTMRDAPPSPSPSPTPEPSPEANAASLPPPSQLPDSAPQPLPNPEPRNLTHVEPRTRLTAPLPVTKKSTPSGTTRQASGAQSVNKRSHIVGAMHPDKQFLRQQKLDAPPPRSTGSCTRAAPVLSLASTNATPPGDRSSSVSSLSPSLPTLRRSTRTPQYTPAPASGSCTVASTAPSTPAATSAPPPPAGPSPSGKRKREDADNTPMRPTRVRKLTARALEALEKPAYKPRKQRARRDTKPAAHLTVPHKPQPRTRRKAQPKHTAAQSSSPLAPAPSVATGSRKRSREVDDDNADGAHVEVVASGSDAPTTGSHARRAAPAPKRRRA